MMAERDLVRTGISGLDAILSDGIPRGNIILLEGAIGTGKTTMGVEFVYRGASQFDELTETPTRTLMLDRIDNALAQARRRGNRAEFIFGLRSRCT